MQNTLIMNRLPLPKYFDGSEWNTVLKPTRKSIPKYLHEDLPQLKLIQLKERFKQIGKFNCPRLEYFDEYIKKHRTKEKKNVGKSKSKANKEGYEQLQEQLQYALLLCDKQSPVIDSLVSRSRSVKKQEEKKRKSIDKGRYFPGTIELVFRNRRSYFLNNSKKQADPFSSPVTARIQDIKLIPYQ